MKAHPPTVTTAPNTIRAILALSVVVTITTIASLLTATPVAAHHGDTGDYDRSAPVWVSGVLLEARVGAPHTVVQVENSGQAPPLTPPASAFELASTLGPDVLSLLQAAPEGTVGLLFSPLSRYITADLPIGGRIEAIAVPRCDQGGPWDGEYRVQWFAVDGVVEVNRDADIVDYVDGCDREDMPEETFWDTLETTPLAEWVRTAPLVYPTTLTLHLLSMVVLTSAVAALDIRLLRRLPGRAQPSWALKLPSIAAAGLLGSITTGGLLFLADASGYAANTTFLIKVIAIGALTILGGLASLALRHDASRTQLAWVGGVSILGWISVIVLGRFIAFT